MTEQLSAAEQAEMLVQECIKDIAEQNDATFGQIDGGYHYIDFSRGTGCAIKIMCDLENDILRAHSTLHFAPAIEIAAKRRAQILASEINARLLYGCFSLHEREVQDPNHMHFWVPTYHFNQPVCCIEMIDSHVADAISACSYGIAIYAPLFESLSSGTSLKRLISAIPSVEFSVSGEA